MPPSRLRKRTRASRAHSTQYSAIGTVIEPLLQTGAPFGTRSAFTYSWPAESKCMRPAPRDASASSSKNGAHDGATTTAATAAPAMASFTLSTRLSSQRTSVHSVPSASSASRTPPSTRRAGPTSTQTRLPLVAVERRAAAARADAPSRKSRATRSQGNKARAAPEATSRTSRRGDDIFGRRGVAGGEHSENRSRQLEVRTNWSRSDASRTRPQRRGAAELAAAELAGTLGCFALLNLGPPSARESPCGGLRKS
mmetsp:Transcript_10576/g.32581  ORF Transcript_10576/g.32581 Transcript_10576/m.32581 type:complete len:254 (-) Transcript_10576:39-800(-)